jgi:hypothetical protein
MSFHYSFFLFSCVVFFLFCFWFMRWMNDRISNIQREMLKIPNARQTKKKNRDMMKADLWPFNLYIVFAAVLPQYILTKCCLFLSSIGKLLLSSAFIQSGIWNETVHDSISPLSNISIRKIDEIIALQKYKLNFLRSYDITSIFSNVLLWLA